MSRLKLTDYEISMKSGFITEDPLTRLPPYFDPWNNLASSLIQLIEKDTFRDEIRKLPVLDVFRLNGEKEIKLAHLQLTYISSCYLWKDGDDPAVVPKSLPKSIAVPLYAMYQKYDLAPILTYASFFLSNCLIKDPDRYFVAVVRVVTLPNTLPVTYDNVKTIYDLPIGEDWYWFFVIDITTGYGFSACMQALQDVLDGIDEEDEEKMTRSLEQITEAVVDMKKKHSHMHDKFPLESFIQKLSQYFSGYGEGPLPDGLIFEGVKDEPVKMHGPDAGQNPIFKTLDALLGLVHQKDRHEYTEGIFLYMYPSHRKFIYDIRKRPVQLRSVVEKSTNSELKRAYDGLVQAITDFRSYHIQLVAKYVFMGMNRTLTEEQLETMKPVKEFTINYLKGMRNDCKQGIISKQKQNS